VEIFLEQNVILKYYEFSYVKKILHKIPLVLNLNIIS